MEFCRLGARVVMGCRDHASARAAIVDITDEISDADIVYYHLNLASFDSIRHFVAEVQQNEQHVDIVVNNAATVTNGDETGERGVELTFAVNHLGAFLLTTLLLDKISESDHGKIIGIGSPFLFCESH